MTMAPLSAGVELVLRVLWHRSGRSRRLVELVGVNRAHSNRAIALGLVELQAVRGRERLRLTGPGLYYARMVAALPQRPVQGFRLPRSAQGDIERWIADQRAAS